MARYGISPEGTLGVPMPELRGIARELRPLRRSHPEYLHRVAARLWACGVHEARILAGLVDVPALVTPEQADAWVADLDSWDVCDQLQGLFVPTPFAYAKAQEWAGAAELFVKRSGFVLMCALAVHDKRADDSRIITFLDLVEREATDGRNYVKKGVNWALRQIGKRSAACHAAAVASAERILAAHPDSRTARWIARDALRELRSESVLRRVHR
ncbi:MAG: DNA alkylation repair protein [Gammaproteobacteria bacterium]|nr:DNA alkylation repair protein [Gammaproteobacteria bacterium]